VLLTCAGAIDTVLPIELLIRPLRMLHRDDDGQQQQLLAARAQGMLVRLAQRVVLIEQLKRHRGKIQR